MTKPMYLHEEHESLERFLNKVDVLNDVIDTTIEAIGVLAVTVAVFVALKLGGVI